jgi:hypothetical protein
MPDPEANYRLIRDNARRIAEEQARRREVAAVMFGHSRTGLLLQFLRQLADRIDPTGEARARKFSRDPGAIAGFRPDLLDPCCF